MSKTPPDVDFEEPKSPKHLAFDIPFGDSKSYDTQRHKALIEKFQNRHKRGQSLSKLDDEPQRPPSSSKAHPSSGILPRKNSLQSDGYFSCDERGDPCINNSNVNINMQYSRLRADLNLPLKNINSDKMTQSFPNGTIILSSIRSPDLELQDISSPELDLISLLSPLHVKPSSPFMHDKNICSPELQKWEETSNASNQKFVEGTEFDFDKSDTPSEAGTYTLDTDNYTEEQRARMSIDRDFNIEQVSGKQKAQEYIQSLISTEKVNKSSVSKTCTVEKCKSKQNAKPSSREPEVSSVSLTLPKRIFDQKKLVSPILSPTQNFSITDKLNSSNNSNIQRCNQEDTDESNFDQGCITSITTSGAFGCKNNIRQRHRTRTSLTKSHTEIQTYIDPNHKSNIIQRSEDKNITGDELIHTDLAFNRLSTLPPVIGGCTGKSSPSKIPSPVNSASSRPRSRCSTVDSDSSLETESFLKPTQTYINSLQKRLSLDSDQEGDFKKCNLRLNNEVQTMAHNRHNSYDDKNLHISNKLEHFHNKSLQSIDQTYINKFNQFANQVHKIHNSPNNSPVQRSSSFSTNKNQVINAQAKLTNLAISSVSKQNNLRYSPKPDQNNTKLQSTTKSYLVGINHATITFDHSRVSSQFADTESSSEEDFEKNSMRKKDLSALSSTRYNRAFALRRARLDEPPVPKCPNTPEMRRKFQTPVQLHSERAASVDRRPVKNSVPSRYLQSSTKMKTTEKVETPKIVPKYHSEKSHTISRTDSGRFSIRSSKPNLTIKQKNSSKEIGGMKPTGCRSNSSLSSREVDFQNWKRRKSYDPMKAAAEGKKKVELARKQCQNPMTQSYNENQQSQDCDSSPSHSSSVHRSQSFHGTAALAQFISSEEEDDMTLSADEGFSPPAPSPYRLSPTRMISRQPWRGKLLN